MMQPIVISYLYEKTNTSGPVMQETPVTIRTMKLSQIGPGSLVYPGAVGRVQMLLRCDYQRPF